MVVDGCDADDVRANTFAAPNQSRDRRHNLCGGASLPLSLSRCSPPYPKNKALQTKTNVSMSPCVAGCCDGGASCAALVAFGVVVILWFLCVVAVAPTTGVDDGGGGCLEVHLIITRWLKEINMYNMCLLVRSCLV